MGFRIEHRLGMPAPAHVVWEVLKDIEAWPQWNPLYTQVSGPLRIGSVLSVVEALPGHPPETLRPTILDWVPEDQIHWRAATHKGFIKRVRYFELEALGDGCIFSNGEIHEGFLTRYTPRSRRRAMREGFEAFGEALKAKVVSAA